METLNLGRVEMLLKNLILDNPELMEELEGKIIEAMSKNKEE